jgi:hypothetical protein
MNVHNLIKDPGLEEILAADAWARTMAHRTVAAQPDIG